MQVLRVLLKLLETSRESRTLAVGASDLGNFISAHPHGRSIVTGTQLLLRLRLGPSLSICTLARHHKNACSMKRSSGAASSRRSCIKFLLEHLTHYFSTHG